jgi:putative SOS response-associated peptidase YedK
VLHQTDTIDKQRDGESVNFMLRPYPADDMDCYRVSKLVNNARNDSPDGIKPAGPGTACR